MGSEHTTEAQLASYSDREIQEKYHDTMVDCLDDLSGSLWLHDEVDIFKKELERRSLEPLPWLNGML